MKKNETAKPASALKNPCAANNKIADFFCNNGVLSFLLAFIIPFLIMLIAFQKQDIFMYHFVHGKLQESGSKQFLVVDLWHQYYPFFRVMREKLLNGGSLLYSWQNGMGTNFLSLMAYYTASPLNFLSVFFDDEHTREALMLFLAAKIGFCSAFFSCFLRYTFRRKDLSIVPFSVMFALCSYTLGYYWNVMWFDTIAVFPLVMLGVVAICRERKWKFYTVTLCLSLVFNYYIGLFTCIFTVIAFLSVSVISWKGVKDFFIKLWIIFRSSVTAIAMGAFILLPTYLALQLTHSANNTFPSEMKWTEKWYNIFGNLLSYSEPTSREGFANIACGMLALMLLGVFVIANGVKIREKIFAVLSMAFILISINENQLNFMWHGFHVTNQLPYRYSFIFSFILIAAAYRAYDVIAEKGIKLYYLPVMLIAPIIVFCMRYISDSKSDKGFSFSSTHIKSSLYITAAYLLVFICIKLISIKKADIERYLLGFAVAVVVTLEMGQTCFIGVNSVGSSDRASYPSYNREVQNVLEVMRIREGDNFHRAEFTTNYTLNDSALYGFNGLSQFSSSANESVTKLFGRLGLYYSEAGNRFYYRSSTPVVNTILGIDYIVSKLGEMHSNNAFFTNICNVESANLYENNYRLSLGFMMNNAVLDVPESVGANTFEYQNLVMKKASGLDIDIFTAQPVSLVTYNNFEADKMSFGEYIGSVTDSSIDATADYEFSGIDGSYLYCYANGSTLNSVSVSCDGTTVDSNVSVDKYSIIIPFGDGQGGSVHKASLKFKADNSYGNTYNLYTYALSKEAFETVYSRLAEEQLNITEFRDTRIKGTLNTGKNGVLYLAVPYEKGWTAYIDGQKAETVPVLGAMLGVKTTAGNHEVVLEYSPDGFREGIYISIAGILLFLIFACAEFVLKKKKPSAEAAAETEAASEKIAEDKAEKSVSAKADSEKVKKNEKS